MKTQMNKNLLIQQKIHKSSCHKNDFKLTIQQNIIDVINIDEFIHIITSWHSQKKSYR